MLFADSYLVYCGLIVQLYTLAHGLILRTKYMTSIISVKHLTKEYYVAQREEGIQGSIKFLFSRKYDVVRAVDSISFEIAAGEIVGYIGRNGAGKSTTIKMLTGVLVPSSGTVTVDGRIPYKNRAANGQVIGVVFGQRTQLKWDIPVIESFRFLKELYRIPTEVYQSNLALFADVLELDGLFSWPVRKLSLGQRMKCDLAASFMHNPKIIYLDEPTIGLDIVIKESVRNFIKTVNREQNTTVILTTHDLDDIEDICKRTIVIDQGKVVFDGKLDEIKERFSVHKFLTFEVRNRIAKEDILSVLPSGATLIEVSEHQVNIRVNRKQTSSSNVIRLLIDHCDVQDISIEEPSIESVVKRIYQDKWDDANE